MTEKISALVKKPRLIKHKGVDQGSRKGKGFSKKELEAVGLDFKKAKKLGLPIDKRRKSMHQENVELLKRFLDSNKS